MNYVVEHFFIDRHISNLRPGYPFTVSFIHSGLKLRDKRNFEYFQKYDGVFFDSIEYSNTNNPFEEKEVKLRLNKKNIKKYYAVASIPKPIFNNSNYTIKYLSPILKVKNADQSNYQFQFDREEFPYLIQIISAGKKDVVVQCYLLKMNKKNKIIAHQELFITGEMK